MLKKILRALLPNPFDALLRRAQKKGDKRFLLFWNRGLGDIALGLFAIVYRIKSFIPDADITFVTREDLKQGFQMLPGVKTQAVSSLKRYAPFNSETVAKEGGICMSDYDCVIEHPDPTFWVKWQLSTLQPKLSWNKEWDQLANSFSLPNAASYVAVHVHSETQYGYEKNWPTEYWSALFTELEKRGIPCLLFGNRASFIFSQENVVDLRGQTSLLQMLSLIKNRCHFFIGPDSGILSLLYYLDTSFPITLLSLWADPHQGILKQNVASPNPLLKHMPLIAPDKDLKKLSVEELLTHL